MNEFKLLPDDPKLTAYALGELEGDERAAVEAALQANPALGAVVEEIRAMAGQLVSAMASEPAPQAPSVAAADPTSAKRVAADPYSKQGTPKLLRFPQVYYLFGGLAAACFAVVFALRPPAPAPVAVAKHYVEMPLAPLEKTEPEAAATAEVAAVAMPKVEENSPASASPAAAPVFDVKGLGLLDQAKAVADQRNADAWAKAPLQGNYVAKLEEDPRARAERKQAMSLAVAAQATRAETSKSWGGVYRLNSTLAGTRVASSGLGVKAAFSYSANQTIEGLPANRPNTESYTYRAENDFLAAMQNPLSTFSIDVDTASYSNVRRMLLAGQRPPADAVRIEELLNYFPYKYSAPAAKDSVPFAATMEMADAPWATNHRLVRIGLKGREVSMAERGAANLVFLLDVSGSMNQPNKLPLVQESMRLLLARLRPDDRVAIVVYAGATGLALPSTPVKQARDIAAAIDELHASGSTNGAMGIQLAYDIAKANFVEGGINRVVLCTDGDFNVGMTSEGELVRLITEKAKSKVFLTVLGFGMGNYKDATLQQLADAGNGNYGYVDTRREAEKLLVEQVSGTLLAIAKDVKLQVEFNPAKVASYRLIGYEKRMLKTEDFNNDKIDAGEIGAGHTVTALYEVVPVGADQAPQGTAEAAPVDELRYVGFGSAPLTMKPVRPEVAGELLTVKVRYKEPTGDTSKRLEFPLADRGAAFAMASADFKFAAAVAGFGMILRDSPHKGAATLADVQGWAEAGIGSDPGGYRAEFVGLVQRARALE